MITTLATVKTFLGIAVTDNTQDTLLNIYLQGMDELFNEECHREFDSTAYVNELLDGNGGDALWVKNPPIVVAPIVFSGRASAINIRNTDTTATYAQALVDKDNSKLTLTLLGGSNPGSDDVDWATYTTLSTVVTQINTLSAKGWVASIYDSNLNNEVSPQLLPESIMCGSQRGIAATDETLKIPDEPINIERFEGATGGIYKAGGFASGIQNYAVRYTGGYTAATMPNNLIEAVCEGVKALYDRGEESGFGVESFSSSDLTIKFTEWLPASTLAAMDFYRIKVIV